MKKIKNNNLIEKGIGMESYLAIRKINPQMKSSWFCFQVILQKHIKQTQTGKVIVLH